MNKLIILGLIGFYIALFLFISELCLKIKGNPEDIKIIITITTVFAGTIFKEIFNKIMQLKFDYIKSLNLFKRRKKKKVKK